MQNGKGIFALIMLTIAAGMLFSGCICCPKIPDNIVLPSPTPTLSPSPSLNPIQMQYNFVEHLNLGKASHNAGIDRMVESNVAYNHSEWKNASAKVLEAQTYMDAAMQEYNKSLEYALMPEWAELAMAYKNVSWAYYMSYDFQNKAYIEGEYQYGRNPPNFVMFNYYIDEANRYMHMAADYRESAKAIEARVNLNG